MFRRSVRGGQRRAGGRADHASRAGVRFADRRRQGGAAGHRSGPCRPALRAALRRLQPGHDPRGRRRGDPRGADVTQEDRAVEPYYSVRIRVAVGKLAGWPVDAFIQAAPRTVASFLVKPFGDQLGRAFRGR